MGTDKIPTAIRGKGNQFVEQQNVFRKNGGRSAPALADNSTCGLALDAVLRSGNGIILSRTSDGGAISITILVGDKRQRTYCSNDEELEEALSAMREAFSS